MTSQLLGRHLPGTRLALMAGGFDLQIREGHSLDEHIVGVLASRAGGGVVLLGPQTPGVGRRGMQEGGEPGRGSSQPQGVPWLSAPNGRL